MTENKMNRFNTLHDIYNAFCDILSSDVYLPYERWIVDLYNCNSSDIQQQIDKCMPKDNFEECYKYLWIGHYYKYIEKNYDLMKKYYLMAIEKGDISAMNDLAYYYINTGDYEAMKKYYLMAIDKGDISAMNNLGYYYQHIEKDYDLMKKYYLMAVDKISKSAMYNLGWYYQCVEKEYDLMKKYYLMAIEKGVTFAMCKLGHYYQCIEKEYDLMKKYYLMAIEKGATFAMHKLGYYYVNIEKNYVLATKFYILYFGHNKTDFNNIIKLIKNPIACCYICNKLNISVPSSHNYYKYYIKINKHMSIHNCEICVTDNVECVPVNWCGHEVCIYCYINLYDKACPYCRMD